MSTPCGRYEICDFEEGLYFLAPCGDRELLLIVIPNLFRNLLNFTPSPLVGEGWGEGEYTSVQDYDVTLY